MSSIQLYGYITLYLFIDLLMGIWVISVVSKLMSQKTHFSAKFTENTPFLEAGEKNVFSQWF